MKASNMAKVVEYGTYIIDITDAMIEHRRGLTTEQLELLEQINQRAVTFVTLCLQNESTDLPTLHRFLSEQAPRYVELIKQHSEFLLKFRKLHQNYREAIKNIHQCSLAIRHEITNMRKDLNNFMSKIGMQIPNAQPAKPARKKPIRRLQRKPALNVDYLSDAPLPPKPEPKPIQRLQPKSQSTPQPTPQSSKVLYPNLSAS